MGKVYCSIKQRESLTGLKLEVLLSLVSENLSRDLKTDGCVH